MTSVAGASQYRTAAILANQQGYTSASSNLVESLGAVDILDVGRSLYGDNGIGLSSSARSLNKQFLESSSSTFNTIFSLGVSETSSVEALQTQIAALRASLPESSLSRETLGALVDEEA